MAGGSLSAAPLKACTCIFKSVSVVVNVTVTVPHTVSVRQRNALADAECLTLWAQTGRLHPPLSVPHPDQDFMVNLNLSL